MTQQLDQQSVFMSYSRKDAGLVAKVGLIVWASGKIPWRDEASILPGERWRTSIIRSIEECDRMLVFWCRHSRVSAEVQREYLHAIQLDKPVVPVRLDRSLLSTDLGRYQAVDISDLIWWSHEIFRWERISWLIGIVLLAIGGVYAVFSA